MEILIAKGKTAGASKTIKLGNDNNETFPTAPVTLYFLGASLAGGETVTVQFLDGTTWRNMYSDGDLVSLTATNNTLTIYGPLEFRVYKTITVADIGVGISHVRGLTV
jgi:hypothetical protein